MSRNPTHIRSAGEDDLEAVRALLVETWHDTYDALLGAARVTEITDSWHAVRNLRPQLGLSDASFLVAEREGRIVGHLFASARDLPPLLLSRLYVRPAWQRQGIGGALLAEALARHPAAGSIRLDVAAGNERAIAFYRRAGFAAVGEVTEGGIRHIRMERQLRPL